jgi:hypothetical protein
MTAQTSNKARMARWAIVKHQWLALAGGIGLLIWGLSGLTHIWMVLFGPQQAVFMPPVRSVMLADARPVAETLAAAGIDQAIAVRTVPGPGSTLYQVTTGEMNERRYFEPASGQELPGQDARQAEFLARHYLKESRPVTGLTLQTAFDDDYPWVNRLLPVWVVRFAGDDGLVAYIHTETSSLAAVNNNAKAAQQRIFRWLHNWDWIPEGLNGLRVAVVASLVGVLAALAITGIIMLISIRRGSRLPGARGWHRIAGYVLALPLLLFSMSGVYHLLQFAIDPPVNQLLMPKPLNLASGRFPIERDWVRITGGRPMRGLSLIEGPQGQPLYRLDPEQGAMAMGSEHDHHDHTTTPPTTPTEIRKARFDGLQPGASPVYIDAANGEILPLADRDLALSIARRFVGPDVVLKDATLVTRFGVDYDFRNKRLPVWKLDFAAPVKASLFVDTATGALVDRVADWQKPERWVFSLAHKWNFLFPLGKLTLNMVVGGAVIALIILMALLGLWIDLKRRKARQRAPETGPRGLTA